MRGAVAWLRAAPAVAIMLVAAPGLSAQETGTVGGRILDRETSQPVPGVLVRVPGVEPTLSDEQGVFILREVPSGQRTLTFEHLAYGEHRRGVLVESEGELALDVTISPRAIELSPLVVESVSDLEFRRRTTGHSMNEIRAAEIEQADRAGMNLSQLLQAAMPGVLVRPGFGGAMCVTYRAISTGNNLGDCDGVSVILDGVPISDPAYIYRSIPLSDIDRLEMLSPGQGGVRYGMRSGQSVLLIETKRGQAQRRSDLSRLVTGLGWEDEAEPYPWLGVYGHAFLANAIGVGIGLALADRCFHTPERSSAFALRTRCGGAETTGASLASVVLPATIGALAARRGGRTERSQGRAVPSMVTAGMLLTGGYLMLIGGDGPTEVGGAIVLGVGVPAAMTVSDRIFRVLR